MEQTILIDKMTSDDWEQVKNIYLEGISTGNATFETDAPSWEAWDRAHIGDCRLVVRSDLEVLGWAALTPVSSRCVYAGVAEVSVYVSPLSSGKGIGSMLLKSLIEKSEEAGFWTLQSAVFPENISSIKLHKNFGFREVGRRERIGKMNGIWRDTIFLERRSDTVGLE